MKFVSYNRSNQFEILIHSMKNDSNLTCTKNYFTWFVIVIQIKSWVSCVHSYYHPQIANISEMVQVTQMPKKVQNLIRCKSENCLVASFLRFHMDSYNLWEIRFVLFAKNSVLDTFLKKKFFLPSEQDLGTWILFKFCTFWSYRKSELWAWNSLFIRLIIPFFYPAILSDHSNSNKENPSVSQWNPNFSFV